MMRPEHTIHIIGVSGNSLTAKDLALIGSCAMLVAAEKMRPLLTAMLPAYPSSRIIPILPLAAALSAINEGLSGGDVAVLASGDPLFFGIGSLLGKHFGPQQLRIQPAVSSMQLAFARLGLAWHDARFLSLHGRARLGLTRSILACPKLCILTDQENNPPAIAREILTCLPSEQAVHCRCFVGENLGGHEERLTSGSLAEITERQFRDPNVMIILQDGIGRENLPVFGLQENELHHSRGLITKDELRAAAIHALALPRRGVFWDVGAGSGSLSIETARLAEDLEVYAIERHDEQLAHISNNRSRYSAWNVQPVRGEAPAALVDLPPPERIFIGGSGGNLERIIEVSANRLKKGGRIVVSAVLDRTAADAPRFLYAQGLEVEIKRIEVSRQYYPSADICRLNPISIIIGRKSVKG